MATRQYIGARYVPKFYENSLGTAEWQAGVMYEPLTIVTYNGNSYTSKRNVPANVGAPNENTFYWVSTGNFNEQLQELTNKFNALPTVNPADFGAVGDGVTDDTAAIETAGAAGIIYGESGKTYKIGSNCDIANGAINADFLLDKDATISGGNLFFMCKFHKNRNVLDDNTRGKWLLKIKEKDFPYVSNCEFYDAVSCLYLDRVNDAKVENNYFHDIIQTPTALSLGGNGYGVLTVQCNHVTISDNLFKNVARHSVYVSHDDESVPCNDIYIKNNTFWNTSAVSGNTSGFEYAVQIRPANNIVIDGNTFDGTKQPIATVRQEVVYTGTVEGVKNIIVSNNIFRNISNTLRPSDGIVTGTVEGAETLQSNVKEITNLKIVNNLCDNCPIPIFKGTSIEGLFIEGNTHTVASANQYINFSDVTQYRQPKDVHIRNNIAKCSFSFLHIAGTAGSVSIDVIDISNNEIECNTFADFFAGIVISTLKLIGNCIKSATTGMYTNNMIPSYVYAEGNSSNVRFSWSAVITDTVFYSWDNVFARISADDIDSTLRSGSIIATPNGHLIGIDAGGTAKQLV